MRKDNEKDQAFIEEVKQKLDWYINDAPADEYDEKAVASLEYLLETLEPTDDFKVDEEKAWVEFKKYVSERQIHNEKKGENPPTTTTQQKRPAFLFRHKGLVAAAILVLLLAVSISTSSEAVRDNGFFHWIKEMTGGREMITVPEDIGASVEPMPSVTITDRNDIPEEWKEWSEIEQEVMAKTTYNWGGIEINETLGQTVAKSLYYNGNDVVIVSAVKYANKQLCEAEKYDRDTERFKDNDVEIKTIRENDEYIYEFEFFEGVCRYCIAANENSIDDISELILEYKQKILKKNCNKLP